MVLSVKCNNCDKIIYGTDILVGGLCYNCNSTYYDLLTQEKTPYKNRVTPEFLLKNGFTLYKTDGIITMYILDHMIFEFGLSNFAILRKKINDDESEFIAGIEFWEDITDFYK